MEKIKNISIQYFKSIKEASLEDCRKVNLLIGYPNVGKSNILEAMSLFCNVDKPASLKNLIRFDSLNQLAYNGNYRNDIQVRLNEEKIKCIFDFNSANSGLLSFYQNSEEKSFFSISYSNGGSSFSMNGSSIERLDIVKYNFTQNVKLQRNQYTNLSVPYGENLVSILELYKILRESIYLILKEYGLKFNFNQTTEELNLLKELDETTVLTIPIHLTADSFQRLIFHKAAIASNQNSILLFEEPEAHIFPPYIRQIAQDIFENKNNNQYFITTHSTDILQFFIDNEEVRNDLSVYILHYDQETKVTRIKDKDIIRVGQAGIDLFYNIENFI